MHHFLKTAFAAAALSGCAAQPDRPTEYVTPEGDGWVISTISSGVSGTVHLMINSERVASGSFGLVAGNKASGGGTYRGRQVTFHCVRRYKPDCLIYADGKLIAETKYSARE